MVTVIQSLPLVYKLSKIANMKSNIDYMGTILATTKFSILKIIRKILAVHKHENKKNF